ncbi:alkaline phosphatase [Jiella endophytica]|uniref:Alkaline phosphatase n=1 Tax=Jiella endophytica TaxID=2558362 RepID=A0A4Y8RFU4_9HYPH|nr:alkaline phosphatase [Jiella endophytica]TFF20583.1 alkaline phosphatase [Jiella endophytica]
MLKTLLLASVAALVSTAAIAQESLPQESSQWFTDAQAKIKEVMARQPNTKRAKNVILLIADGNGVTTNYATRLWMGQQEGGMGDDFVQPQEAFPYLALAKTYNINAQTPDSAPTAGSMNTGVKQLFNTINVSDKAVFEDCASVKGNELETFAEMVSKDGKSVGVLTTARLTHATPAAVYAKTAARDWEDAVPEGCTAQKDIAAQLVDQMKAGVIDLAMGGGRRHFIDKSITLSEEENTKGKRTDGKNLIDEAKAAGAEYAWNTETFKNLKLDGKTPVLGLFEDSHMKYEADRTDEDEPSLADMTKAAIEYLSKNDKGYYLEIEGGRVDHANHDGNAYRAVTDGAAFSAAVAMADEMTDDEDTLIIVTADHEHSIALNGYCGRGSPILGLCYEVNTATGEGNMKHADTPNLGADNKPYTVIGYLNGAGSVLKEQSDKSYSGSRPDLTDEEAQDKEYLQQALVPMSSETHSGVDVAIYAKGPWSHLFDGTVEQNYIFHVMNQAVHGDGMDAAENGGAMEATPASAN